MAQDIVGGLFGITPEMYQQQQNQVQNAQAIQYAQMKPMEAAQYGAFRAGQQLGNVLPGLMGVEDPQLAMIRDVQSMRSQFDVSSPQGLRQFAQALSQKGYTDLAMQAAKKAADIDKEISQAEKNRTEKLPQIANLQLYRDRLIQAFGANDPRVAEVNAEIKGLAEKGTKVNVQVAGEKNILDIDKKDAETLVSVRNTAEKTIPRLEEQLKAVNKGIVAGQFNDARKVMLNSLATFGIKDKTTMDLLANTDKFNANRIELASAVAKQLGVNPTDRDFQASLDRFASGSMQPEVAVSFINDMLTIQRKNLKDAQGGLDYFRANKGSFAGYNRPLPQSPVAADPLQNMSIEELKALEKKLLKNKKD